eukprot:CAMPEP_0113264594 /NCGR_PEP_ID=MMETSP0008_2-20120614/19056_1 /TAXON_ID=97485 /ORGANISM="Prymnesium parvum" /LENGTH=88 /DNA_ID=CAMNT_0000113365 /DNA_START=657 /DNA_END=923 /DNA_ORIENTATION=+ /assembly_acc=CAM_ASM_000153
MAASTCVGEAVIAGGADHSAGADSSNDLGGAGEGDGGGGLSLSSMLVGSRASVLFSGNVLLTIDTMSSLGCPAAGSCESDSCDADTFH